MIPMKLNAREKAMNYLSKWEVEYAPAQWGILLVIPDRVSKNLVQLQLWTEGNLYSWLTYRDSEPDFEIQRIDAFIFAKALKGNSNALPDNQTIEGSTSIADNDSQRPLIFNLPRKAG